MTETEKPFSMFVALRGGYETKHATAFCDVHGEYRRDEFFDGGKLVGARPPRCVLCADEEKRQQALEQRQADRMQRTETLLRQSGIAKRYARCTTDNFASHTGVAAAFAAVKGYLARWPEQRKTGECLILLGDLGTGKTHLGCAMVRAVIEYGDAARYATVSGLLADVRATWRAGRGERSEQDVVDEFATVPLLVLDEIGATHGSENERVILFDILDRRYQEMLPTVVSGNVSAAELEAALEARSVDRLREGGGKAYRLTGKSYRGAA